MVTSALRQNRVHPQVRGQELILCGHCSHGNLPKETKYERVTNGQRPRAHWEKLYVTRKQWEISTKLGSRNAVMHRPGRLETFVEDQEGLFTTGSALQTERRSPGHAQIVHWFCRWSPDGGGAHPPVNRLGWEQLFRSCSSFAPIFCSSSNLWIYNLASWVNSGGKTCKCLLTLSLIKNSSMCPHHPQAQTFPSNF